MKKLKLPEIFKKINLRSWLAKTSSDDPNSKFNLLKEKAKKVIQNFDPQATLDWASKKLQKRSAGFYGTLATVTLSTFFVSDLTSLLLDQYIPEPPVTRAVNQPSPRNKTIADYNPIFTRNLFNSLGLIPGEDGNVSTPGSPSEMNGVPVKTTLPFNLLGVIIMEDERHSVGTIEDKSANQSYPVQIDDEIPGKALILQVQPKAVIFINKISNRKEYVELPSELKFIKPFRISIISLPKREPYLIWKMASPQVTNSFKLSQVVFTKS
ncbi:MAG: hypothetical protein HYX41_03225 [Bdellovibrio sp.]|nr:hypothetical protein [Bdellovibrio sp.]